MRILLDECVPAALVGTIIGHEVRTVPRMRWSGLRNGALLRHAAQEFEVFLTLDRSIQHQQGIPASLTLITLRVHDSRVETVLARTGDILAALEHIEPGAREEIGGPFLIRIDPPRYLSR